MDDAPLASPVTPNVYSPVQNPIENHDAASSVRPSVQVGDAHERARDDAANHETDGRTDGGEVDQRNQEQAGEPKSGGAAPTAPAAPVASEGVALLMEAARRDERASLPGPMLNKHGLYVTGLLAGGWQWSEVMAQITAPRPPKDKIRVSDEALTAARILAIPMAPPKAPGQTGAPVPPQASRAAAAPARSHECQGLDGQCGRPVSVAGGLCRSCRTPCAAGCGESSRPGRGDGLCTSCGDQHDVQALPPCSACGEQPATRTSGLCSPCHRARQDADQEQAATGGDVEPEEAFAALLGTHGATRPGGCVEGTNGCQRDAVRDDRCEVCHELWTAYQRNLDEWAPAYADQEGASAPF